LRAAKTHEVNMRAAKHLKNAFHSRKVADLNPDEIEFYLRKRLRDRVRIKTAAGFIEPKSLSPQPCTRNFGCCGAC
jgi:hypothetical protein